MSLTSAEIATRLSEMPDQEIWDAWGALDYDLTDDQEYVQGVPIREYEEMVFAEVNKRILHIRRVK